MKALLDRLRSSQAWQDTLHSQPSSSSSNAVSHSSDPPLASASSTLETHDEISHGDASSRPEGPKYDVTIATSLSSGSTSDVSAPPGTSVASLLSQLQAYIPPSTSSLHVSENDDNSSVPPYPHPEISTSYAISGNKSVVPDFPSSSSFTFHVPPPNPAPSTNLAKPDIQSYTFQQSLPVVAQLADDPKFIEAIATVRHFFCPPARTCFDPFIAYRILHTALCITRIDEAGTSGPRNQVME